MDDKLTIDSTFSEIFTPLSKETFKILEESILEHGCLDTIKVWRDDGKDIIVDGQNRYWICTKHDIPYGIDRIEAKTLREAVRFALNYQDGRRNETPTRLKLLRGRLLNEQKKSKPGRPKGSKTKKSGGDGNGVNLIPFPTAKRTRDRIAEAEKVSPSTAQRDAQFAKNVKKLAEPVKEAILDEKVKASAADVAKLATIPKTKQEEAVKAVSTGKAPNLKAALTTDKPKKGEVKESFNDKLVTQAFSALVKILNRRSKMIGNGPHYKAIVHHVNEALKHWEGYEDKQTGEKVEGWSHVKK